MAEWQSYDIKKAKAKSIPKLNDLALYGSLGEATIELTKNSEAAPPAVLGCLLTLAGNYMNGRRYVQVGKDVHYAILFLLVIGKSAKGRKGFAKNLALDFFTQVDPTFKLRMKTGLTSGEGLVAMVSDFYEKQESGVKKAELIKRPEEEKIRVVVESEGARLLRVMERTGNTLSAVLRDVWDASDLAVENKNSPIRSTRPLVSLIGNITLDELKLTMQSIEISNGFANRFLAVFTERTRIEPKGGKFDDHRIKVIADNIRQKALQSANLKQRIFRFTDEADEFWFRLYTEFAEHEAEGMIGSLTARAEPMILRIAMIYAYYDGEELIDFQHLQAAYHLWNYSEQSWRYVYGDSLGNPLADEILKYLRSSATPCSRTDINNHFQRNRTKEQLQAALFRLYEARLIECLVDGSKHLFRPIRREPADTNNTNSTNYHDAPDRTSKEPASSNSSISSTESIIQGGPNEPTHQST